MSKWKSLKKKVSPERLSSIRQASKKEKTQERKDAESLIRDILKLRKRLQKDPHVEKNRTEAESYVTQCNSLLSRLDRSQSDLIDKISRLRDAMDKYVRHYDELYNSHAKAKEYIRKQEETYKEEERRIEEMKKERAEKQRQEEERRKIEEENKKHAKDK